MSLLNGFTKATGGEVHLPTEPLGLVITQPVLQKRGAILSLANVQKNAVGKNLLQGGGAQSVEAESLTGMNDSQLPSHCQDRTLARRVRELGSSSANQGDDTSCVDDTATGLLVTTQTEDSVLAAEPDTLHIDVVCEVPDLLGGIDGICVVGVHDSSIVEDHVSASPAIL